jgi:hypothetical protein
MTGEVEAVEAIESTPMIRGTPIPPESPDQWLDALLQSRQPAEDKDRKLGRP